VNNMFRLWSQVPARQLASVIGRIVAMSLEMGPVTWLMTHCLYSNLNRRTSWCQRLCLTGEALQELDQQLANFNGQSIWPKPSTVRVAYSDTSASGYGGYIVEHGNLIANGQWSKEEASQSSLHGRNFDVFSRTSCRKKGYDGSLITRMW